HHLHRQIARPLNCSATSPRADAYRFDGRNELESQSRAIGVARARTGYTGSGLPIDIGCGAVDERWPWRNVATPGNSQPLSALRMRAVMRRTWRRSGTATAARRLQQVGRMRRAGGSRLQPLV